MSIDLIRFLIFVAVLVGLVIVALSIPAFRPYLRKNPMVTFLLGISSGFPLTLLIATMTFWLAKVGIDTATIGFAVALGHSLHAQIPVGAARRQIADPVSDQGVRANGADGCS